MMAFRDVFLHVDNGARSPVRVKMAVELAARHTARLRVLFADCDPYLANLASLKPEAMYRESAERLHADLERSAGAAGVAVSWDTVIVRRDSALTKEVIHGARHSDLTILGQYDPQEQASGVPSDLAEHVLLSAGRPGLVIPFAGEFPTLGERIMIAWNAGREAARAVHDALPFLASAKQVTVLVISPVGKRSEKDPEGGADVARYLEAHDVAVRLSRLVGDETEAMDLLLSRVADDGIDLLVMGAHGHYAFPSLQKGSGTRHILRHMTVPVLMAH